MQKLEQNRNHGIMRVTEHVHKLLHEGAFKGHVYGPIATEIKMKAGAPAHAAHALENAIAQKIQAAFVTEYREDQDTLLRCDAARLVFSALLWQPLQALLAHRCM